jgi:hypothetical protein
MHPIILFSIQLLQMYSVPKYTMELLFGTLLPSFTRYAHPHLAWLPDTFYSSLFALHSSGTAGTGRLDPLSSSNLGHFVFTLVVSSPLLVILWTSSCGLLCFMVFFSFPLPPFSLLPSPSHSSAPPSLSSSNHCWFFFVCCTFFKGKPNLQTASKRTRTWTGVEG